MERKKIGDTVIDERICVSLDFRNDEKFIAYVLQDPIDFQPWCNRCVFPIVIVYGYSKMYLYQYAHRTRRPEEATIDILLSGLTNLFKNTMLMNDGYVMWCAATNRLPADQGSWGHYERELRFTEDAMTVFTRDEVKHMMAIVADTQRRRTAEKIIAADEEKKDGTDAG